MQPEVRRTVIRNLIQQEEDPYVFISLRKPPLVLTSGKLAPLQWAQLFEALALHLGLPFQKFRHDVMLKMLERPFADQEPVAEAETVPPEADKEAPAKLPWEA
jgi:hypothetical protein